MGTEGIGNYLEKTRGQELWRKVRRALKLMFSHLSECFFLGLANKLPRNPISDRAYCKLLRFAGIKMGWGAIIWGPLEIRPIGAARNIKIGNRVFINSGVRFGCPPPGEIIIGNHVAIGPRVLFETLNHSLTCNADGFRPGKSKKIIVEDYVWIGANVTILPNVRIGEGSVIAAGAVVTKDVPPYCLVAGVPARVLKKLKD